MNPPDSVQVGPVSIDFRITVGNIIEIVSLIVGAWVFTLRARAELSEIKTKVNALWEWWQKHLSL